MNILLTGSHGYIGSALHEKLLTAGHSVIPVDTQWFMPDDKVKPQDVRLLKSIGGAEVIIHLAAIANDPSVAFYPRLSWETGVLATMQLCEMAKASGARIIYASSVSVYGAGRGMVTEGDDLRPLTDYNKTKMAAERVLESYGMPVQIVRPATVCGISKRMRLDLTVNMLTMHALTTGVITLHGGQQMRPSIHIDDMTDLYLWLLNNANITGTFNAGFENNTLLDIAEQICVWVPGTKIQITPERDQRSYQVNSDKVQTAGFRPKKTINHAILELIDAVRDDKVKDEPTAHNLEYMKKLGIKDEAQDVSITAVEKL